jgi:hypothetical protein
MGKKPTPWTVHPGATLGFDLRTLYLEIVEICTLGGVPHVLLSSLAHVGRFRHFVPSTFVYFHFDFG